MECVKAYALLMFLGLSVTAFAADAKEDAADTFVKAYLAFQRAEKSEARGLKQEAMDEYRLAEKLLKAIRDSDAEWNPAIVEHRSKKVSESLERLSKN